MDSMPIAKKSYKTIHDTVMAPIRSKLLMAGAELSVFDEMEDFRSAGDIAGAIGAHAANTERFLNALVTIGLIEKKDGQFRNRPEAAAFLRKNSPTYLCPFLKLLQRMCVDSLDDLCNLVKSGPLPNSHKENWKEIY